MSGTVGRPPLPDGEQRVAICARVAPATAAWLKDRQEESSIPLSRVLDALVNRVRVQVVEPEPAEPEVPAPDEKPAPAPQPKYRHWD